MIKFFTSVRHLGFLVIASLLLSTFAWAWPPTYGAEFELTGAGLGVYNFDKDNPTLSPEKQAQLKFVQQMEARCQTSGCKVVKVQGKWDDDYRVEYADGWWFKISYDPSCVEITFKPSPLDILSEKAELINDQIFGTGKQVGLEITKNENRSSHVNIGIRSAFEDDGMKFLRFFVDYANHSDLALGSIGKDLYNSPPLAVLGEDQRQALKNLVEEFSQRQNVSIAEVASAIQEKVYTRSYYAPWGGIHHYQAVGLKYVNKTDLTKQDAPMELRSVRIQESGEKFNLVARLFEARIQYLNSLKTPIIYVASARQDFSASELLTRFNFYVQEIGLDPADFKALLLASTAAAPISDFADPKADLVDRLSDVHKYWDLIQTSALARKTLVEIMSVPDTERLAQVLQIEEKIRNMAKEAPVVEEPKGLFGFFKIFGRKNIIQSPQLGAAKIFQDLEKDIQAARKNKSTPLKVVPANLPTDAIFCEAIFN